MDTTPSNVAKAAPNEPRDLLARLYRDIGISAVAAALAPAALAADFPGVVIAAPVSIPPTRKRRKAKAA